MDDALSLETLREDGRRRAKEAGAALQGLSQTEGLQHLSALRAGLEERKAALYASGFSPREVQAWAEGYRTGLYDQTDAWLASFEQDARRT